MFDPRYSLYDTTGCTIPGVNVAAWMVSPEARDACVHMYTLAENMIHEKMPVRNLRRAYRHYALFLANIHLVPPSFARKSAEALEEQRSGIVRAMLHRLNCSALRTLAGVSGCTNRCCCSCVASYDGVTCTSDFMHTITQQHFEETLKADGKKESRKA